MERAKNQFQDVAVRVVAVALCQPQEAQSFCGAHAPSITCLCDASRSAYAAYGLADGSMLQVAGPEAIAAGMRAALEGHLPAPVTASDTWRMMPGTFAIDAAGIIRATHYARHSGDQPDLARMLRALGQG